MKAKELRIGNYVKGNLIDVATITGIFNNGLCIEEMPLNLSTNDGFMTLSIDNFAPIPLTEEWLLKFGIDNDKEVDNFPVWVDNGFCSIELYGGHETRHPCKYVHQLQNLYFALTGEELTIKE